MLRDEDEFDIAIDCSVCRRSFGSYASLEDHQEEHEGLKQCGKCGHIIRGPFHKC